MSLLYIYYNFYILLLDNNIGIAFNGFSSYPEPICIEEGKDASFNVMVEDSPTLMNAEVVWQLGGKEVERESTKYKVSRTVS